MCVSLRPASFSDTIVGTFEGSDGRRYLAYQNTAQSLVPTNGVGNSPAPTRRSSPRQSPRLGMIAPRRPSNWTFEDAETPKAPHTGNALILPLPDALDNIKVLDTKTCSKFMQDIRRALTPASNGRGVLRRGKSLGVDSAVRIIQSGIYTVVLSASAKAIARALNGAVAAERRPQLDPDILNAYEEWYPDWSIAVCCFNNTDARRADPLLFSFEPSKQDDPDLFFIPTLDAHDGKRPDLAADVEVDHAIFVSCSDTPADDAFEITYSDDKIAPGIAAQLPQYVQGKVVKGEYRNGDIVFRRADLAKGIVKGLRALPPGAPSSNARIFV